MGLKNFKERFIVGLKLYLEPVTYVSFWIFIIILTLIGEYNK